MYEDYKLSEKIAKATKEKYSKLQELNEQQRVQELVNNTPKLFDYGSVKIVSERDNQQQIEDYTIPKAPKLFDYDSVRMANNDNIVSAKEKSTDNYTKPETPKPIDIEYAIKPKLENPFTPNSNLWKFYERASAESKPAIKTSTEQIIATPKEPDKINTQQKTETNNKPTTPNVKIKEMIILK
ncbi:MAG: hypothetical protein R3Y22_01005 [Bacteroidales bacterium]